MRHTIRLAALVSAVSPVVVPWAVATAQQPPASASLEQTLSTQYPAGTVLVIQRPGIVGSLACPILLKLKLGPPQKVMDLGSKVIYMYKDLKITFIDGKVADIE